MQRSSNRAMGLLVSFGVCWGLCSGCGVDESMPQTPLALREPEGALDESGQALEAWGSGEVEDPEGYDEVPEVVAATPATRADVSPEVVLKLVFSTAMDPVATAAAFSLIEANGEVSGSVSFDISGTVMAFRPRWLLEPGPHVAVLDRSAQSAAGLSLTAAVEIPFAVVPGQGGK